jgi:hypothetical protein
MAASLHRLREREVLDDGEDVESATPAAPSPRQRLAEAVERHRAAARHLEKLNAAKSRQEDVAIDFWQEIDAAEEALKEAEERQPKMAVAALLGDATSPPPDIATPARQRLAAVQLRHQAARNNVALIDREMGPATEKLRWATEDLNECISGLVANSREAAALVKEHDETLAKLHGLRTTLALLNRHSALPASARFYDAVNRCENFDNSLSERWRTALKLLEVDPATPLPDALGSEHGPRTMRRC